MFSALFLANDPGGYNVIYPIFQNLNNENVKLILTGAASEINPKYEVDGNYREYVKYWLKSHHRAILVTGTSWKNEIEMDAVHIAKNMGRCTVSIIDYWSNYKERFKLNSDFIYPDHIFIMDKLSREEAISEGIPSEIIEITGQPMLDKYVGERKEDKCNGRIVFLSQPISNIKGHALGYTEFSVIKDVIAACKSLDYPLDVKFHPKETERFKKTYQRYSILGDFEIVKQYDVVVGMCTMGLLECALMGKRTISYQPGLIGEDYCITNKLGLTNGAFTFDDLYHQLVDRKRQENISDINRIWMDGKSTDRSCKALVNIFMGTL